MLIWSPSACSHKSTWGWKIQTYLLADNWLKLCYREEEKSNPIAQTKLHSSCFDHRRKKVFLAKFSAYEENCFQFVLGVIFADEPSEFDMKKAPYQCI